MASNNRDIENLLMKREAVFVVGMHRSGTSVLVRGLQSLGVDLGSNFHEPALDNLKGFWEDKDILALNDKILHSLACQWDSVRSIPLASLRGDLFQSLREESKSILQKKMVDGLLWGVKDPRLSRLLPFWTPVVKELGIQTHLVMSIRHPVSIVRSLAVRNKMSEEKAVLLCLVHWLDVLQSGYAENMIVTDYDSFLDGAEKCLINIADKLDIDVSSRIKNDINVFSKNFLSDALRHNLATEQDSISWKERGGCFSLVIKLYEQLILFSRGQVSLSDPGWSVLYREFDMLSPMLTYVDALSDASHGRVHNLEYQMGLRDQEIVRLNNVVEESSNDLQTRNSELIQQFELLSQKQETAQAKAHELSGLLEVSHQREQELSKQLELAQDREAQLAHSLERVQQNHNSLLSYQTETKQLLDKERLTVVKPVLRRLNRRALSVALLMPSGVQNRLRRFKDFLIRHSNVSQSPAWGGPLGFESVPEIAENYQLSDCKSTGYDVIVFPVIDWNFRVQRPQHIAKGLADKGHRVFYFSTTFANAAPGGAILEQVEERVFVCQLSIPAPHPVIYERMPSQEQEKWINEALNSFLKGVAAKQIVTVIDHPFWQPTALAIPGAMVVYDCMDDHGGFSNNTDEILQSEEQLLWHADLVVTTSAPLSKKINKKRENILIRNAADSEWFSQPPEVLAYNSERPVVGYFGAISEWFDINLIVESAKTYPEYDFVLVGSTFMCDTRKAESLSNVHFIGEVPYAEIKGYLYAFDVCLIPFKLIELIQCTNPVKLYEYLASGKPVVATDMPELRLVNEHVYVSQDTASFVKNIRLAMESREEPNGIASRKAFALENQWVNRVDRLEQAISDHFPSVSVVVLTYNNIEYTRACLHSLEQFTHYPNWELIIVDNASSDGSREFLTEYEEQHDKVKVILNDDNLGFSAGNNVGVREATGEYVVILNNDTYVTDGWLWGLIRYFQKDNALGLIGPVTNNIGNEAKIKIDYGNMEEMAAAFRQYTQERNRQLLYINTAAFFCVAIKKCVIDDIGLLDESFGRGFFEDDDYCMRTRNAGYKVAVADDVFVHHHLSASFNKLKDSEKQKLFEKNKAIYEAKWGDWEPHRYREF